MGCMEWHPTQSRNAVAEGSSERQCCRKDEKDQEKGTPKAKATLMEQGPCRDMSVRHRIWAHYIRSIGATWHLSIHKFSFDNPLGFRPKSKTVKIKMIRSRGDLSRTSRNAAQWTRQTAKHRTHCTCTRDLFTHAVGNYSCENMKEKIHSSNFLHHTEFENTITQCVKDQNSLSKKKCYNGRDEDLTYSKECRHRHQLQVHKLCSETSVASMPMNRKSVYIQVPGTNQQMEPDSHFDRLIPRGLKSHWSIDLPSEGITACSAGVVIKEQIY